MATPRTRPGGVIDLLAVTDFPDWRMESFVRSRDEGILMVLPREGGHLVRLYAELDNLEEHDRVADRGMGPQDIIVKEQRILQPFKLEVKEVVWWSIYEIGHRLTDKFDDLPHDQYEGMFYRCGPVKKLQNTLPASFAYRGDAAQALNRGYDLAPFCSGSAR